MAGGRSRVGTWPDLDLAALACCLADRFLVAVVVAMGVASRAYVVQELLRGEPSCHFCHVVAREATRRQRVAGPASTRGPISIATRTGRDYYCGGMSPVAIVTDSTAYLPPGVAEEFGVRVVPLGVTIGARMGTDGVDVTPGEVAAALQNKEIVRTSRPSPAEFAKAYQAVLASGADSVVSVHLSAALSGTWESAVLAAQDFGYGVVRVVDSRSTAMALGFAVLAAADAARSGGSPADVQDAAVSTVDATRTYFYVDTLEYLRRGGRVGAASALLATSLSVKPLLHILDGRIVPLEKVRTSAKAIARLVELTVESAGNRSVDVAVHHLAAPDRAQMLADRLRIGIPRLGELHMSELGAVVGAHLGPGVLGTVVVRR
jgi:DegV family protein with EDD domain